MTDVTFHQIAGQGKYVFIDFYSKGCVWCYRLLPDLNKLYDYFKSDRKDILFVKVEGPVNPELTTKFRIQFYPTLILLRPNDTRFGIKYDLNRDFETMTQFLESFPKVGENVIRKMSPSAVEKLCKVNVDNAVAIYEKEVRSKGLLVTKQDLKYYHSAIAGLKHLAEKDDKAKTLVDKLKPIESEAQQSDLKGLEEFQEFKNEVDKETKDKYVEIAENISNRISDVEALLDSRGLQKRDKLHDVDGHQDHSERSKTSKSIHKQDDPVDHPQANQGVDSFAYSYMIKYALCILGGIAAALLYQRLNNLENVVKHIGF